MEAQTPTTESQPPPRRKGSWQLIVAPIVVVLLAFEISFSLGEFYMDRTQPVPTLDWLYGGLAISWLVTTYKRNANTRVRLWALGIVLPLAAVTAVSSFGVGKSAQYPDEARKLVETLQVHLREVKRIKAEVSQARASFSYAEDLITIEPKVAAWKENVEQIDKLMPQITSHQVPSYISQLLTLLGRALPVEKRQIANIEKQIELIHSAQGVRSNEQLLVYRQQLTALMQQEEQIERERQDANLEGKIKDLR